MAVDPPQDPDADADPDATPVPAAGEGAASKGEAAGPDADAAARAGRTGGAGLRTGFTTGACATAAVARPQRPLACSMAAVARSQSASAWSARCFHAAASSRARVRASSARSWKCAGVAGSPASEKWGDLASDIRGGDGCSSSSFSLASEKWGLLDVAAAIARPRSTGSSTETRCQRASITPLLRLKRTKTPQVHKNQSLVVVARSNGQPHALPRTAQRISG